MRTQREKFEEARIGILLREKDRTGSKNKGRTLKARRVALRAKTKRKLVRDKRDTVEGVPG